MKTRDKPKRLPVELISGLDGLCDFESKRVGYRLPKKIVYRKLGIKLHKLIKNGERKPLIDWFEK